MNLFRYLVQLILINTLSCTLAFALPAPARLTVVLVIDQCSHTLLQKVEPYLRGGLSLLLKNGIVYTNSYYPHALPETAPGHAGLSTGTLPKDHGIIANTWYDQRGTAVISDVDPSTTMLLPAQSTEPGKSSMHMMVDGLSDQYMLASTPTKPHHAVALSLKSRAATALASKMCKAIWFDDKNGFFTSSSAYFSELPAWVTDFNGTKKINELQEFSWHLAYAPTSAAYAFNYANDYAFTGKEQGLIGKITPIDRTNKEAFSSFIKTPHANQLLLDLALTCVDQYISKKSHACYRFKF